MDTVTHLAGGSGDFKQIPVPAANPGGAPGEGWSNYPAFGQPTQLPTYYQYQNAVTSLYHPSTTHIADTALTMYYAKYLLQKAMSVLKWELPKTWDIDFFLYVLYCQGRVCILNTDKFGVIPQMCGLGGYNVFYRPRYAVVSNELLGREQTHELNIGEMCSLIYLQANYGGIMDIVMHYAGLMAITTESAKCNIFNSRLAYVFMAENKNEAESMKKMYDTISAGEMAVVVSKDLLDEKTGKPKWQFFNQSINQTYIADKLLIDLRKIESMFATDIGLPNANTDKRERLISDEVNANNVETASKMSFMLEHLQKGCEQTRELFGIDISVDWKVDPVKVEQAEQATSAEEDDRGTEND